MAIQSIAFSPSDPSAPTEAFIACITGSTRKVSVFQPPRTSPRHDMQGTSRGTELRETELISAHLSVPGIAQDEPSERLHGIS